MIGLLVGLFAVVAVAGSFTPACSLCHGTQSRAQATTAHTGVTCYQCHLSDGAWSLPSHKGQELLGMYPKALVGLGYRSPAGQTARNACLRCHASVLEGISTGDGLRVKHSSCATGSSCDSCHAATAHPKATRWAAAPVMEDCVACHKENDAPTECTVCHTQEKERSTRARGPWQVTHGKDWRKMHGMGQTDSCSTCHPVGFCAKCHNVAVPHPADFGATHGDMAIQDLESCQTCHTSRAFCDACHGMPMPHPSGFLKRHSTLTRGDQDPACLRCHEANDCDNCHSSHVHPGGSKGVPVPWQYTGSGQ